MIEKKPKYNLDTVTNFIISYSDHHDLGINNLKLQKILYLVQSQFIVNLHQIYFSNPIYALSFGPVIKSVYNYYKFYGTEAVIKIMPNKSSWILPNDKKLIIGILNQCAKYNDTELLHIIYQQTPFKRALNNNNQIIDVQDLYNFFNQ